MLGVLQGRPNIAQAYAGPARAANGWQVPAAAPQYYQYDPRLYYGAPGAANGHNVYPGAANANANANVYPGAANANANANGWGVGYPGYQYWPY